MLRRLVAVVALVGTVAACASSERAASPSTSTTTTPSTSTSSTTSTTSTAAATTTIAAPGGFDVQGARWIAVARGDGHTQQAAVFTPAGTGPFPTIVYLHGSSGLSVPELQWAGRLADAGFLVLAGCYLARSEYAAFPSSFLPCDDIAPNDPSDGRAVAEGYTALVTTALGLDHARAGPIGVVGVSFGAGVALDADGANVGAVVADSGHGTGDASATGPPVLVLGANSDPMVPHRDVVAYADALRAAGRDVIDHYYESGAHVVTVFGDDTGDATQRAISFLKEHLGP